MKPIQERGLIQNLEKDVKKTIKYYKWELLCDHFDLAVVLVVREFYANGLERDGFTIMVRGKVYHLIAPRSIDIMDWPALKMMSINL